MDEVDPRVAEPGGEIVGELADLVGLSVLERLDARPQRWRAASKPGR
jgi:hypothetical protein